MARESNITQTMINAAADAILAGGTRPSARSVRAAIGFGSMTGTADIRVKIGLSG
ncbi:MAG: DNA-binding protein [Azonexus sp.]